MVGKGPRLWLRPLSRRSVKSPEELTVTKSAKKRPVREAKRTSKNRKLTNARSPDSLSSIRPSQPRRRNRRLSPFVAQPLRRTRRRTGRWVIFVFIRVHGG